MGKPWTSDELIVTLNVYSRLAFGQLHARNPLIVAVAERLRRTPGSLATKLCDLTAFDPQISAATRRTPAFEPCALER